MQRYNHLFFVLAKKEKIKTKNKRKKKEEECCEELYVCQLWNYNNGIVSFMAKKVTGKLANIYLVAHCLLSLEYQYAEKLFVRKPKDSQYSRSVQNLIWEGVRMNDKKAVYRYIVNAEADVNAVYEQDLSSNSSLTLAKAMLLQEQHSSLRKVNLSASTSQDHTITQEDDEDDDVMPSGCSLLHLACETADIGMIELLLQYGANINASDSRGQAPLHRCIRKGRMVFAKLLLTR